MSVVESKLSTVRGLRIALGTEADAATKVTPVEY
jgi:hypothetical protein